uniref:Uncharacterized protein n=1 Tax=Romanomermis culicivorax TaxID=13658 RepID=A0A915LAW2_ROMCU
NIIKPLAIRPVNNFIGSYSKDYSCYTTSILHSTNPRHVSMLTLHQPNELLTTQGLQEEIRMTKFPRTVEYPCLPKQPLTDRQAFIRRTLSNDGEILFEKDAKAGAFRLRLSASVEPSTLPRTSADRKTTLSSSVIGVKPFSSETSGQNDEPVRKDKGSTISLQFCDQWSNETGEAPWHDNGTFECFQDMASSGHSSGIQMTPCTLEMNGHKAEFDIMIRKKDDELYRLRHMMERNEEAIIRVYQEKENKWHELFTKLQLQIRSNVTNENRLLNQVQRLKCQSEDLETRLRGEEYQKRTLQSRCHELENRLYSLECDRKLNLNKNMATKVKSSNPDLIEELHFLRKEVDERVQTGVQGINGVVANAAVGHVIEQLLQKEQETDQNGLDQKFNFGDKIRSGRDAHTFYP